MSAFFTVAVSIAVIVFGIKYRRKHAEEIGAHAGPAPVIPTVLALDALLAGGAGSLAERLVEPHGAGIGAADADF